MSTSAGRVLPIAKGDYNNATTYSVLDWVLYNGKPYIAKQTTEGNLPTDTTYWQLLLDNPTSDFTGATLNANGTHGLVPAPFIADKDKFLKGDGTWSEFAAGDVYFEQTQTLIPGGTTRYTFTGTSAQLPTNAFYQATCNNDDVISCTVSQTEPGTVYVDIPQTGTATATTVRLYVHYANA